MRHGCRLCGTELKHVFMDMGHMPPANSLVSDLSEPETHYPLVAKVCHKCFLVQIADDVPSKQLFNNRYPYFSSSSKRWVEHAKRYVEKVSPMLERTDLVVEIGSNDGYLLQHFKDTRVLGVEPSSDTSEAARTKGISTIDRFFDERLAWEIEDQHGKAKLIICNNVIAHVPNLNMFIRGLANLVRDDGVITVEAPDLASLMDFEAFDTIYHEHFSYFSTTSLSGAFKRHGLHVYHIETLPTHGGSTRYWVSKNPKGESAQYLDKINSEKSLSDIKTYEKWKSKSAIDLMCKNFLNFLWARKCRVVCAGAAAKGITFLNYCGLNRLTVPYVTDNTPYKIGKYTPGGHIPIVAEETVKRDMPKYVIILPWNHAEEIMENMSYVRKWGGKFVTAIPTLTVV